MGKVIGIDLGTTNSCVSVIEGDTYKIIENLDGARTTPSIIALSTNRKTQQEEWLVGKTAANQAARNAANTFYDVKRLIGRRFDDPEVQGMKEFAPFEIVQAKNGDAWINVKGKPTAPEELSAKVLAYLKRSAEKYLGEEVTEAVITVPAYFNDAQRQATKNAGAIAGLKVDIVINEPTAAAVAYGVDKQVNGKVAIFDLGGGTFDVSILDLENDKDSSTTSVLATSGDAHLGGRDFDTRLVEHLLKLYKEEFPDSDITKNANDMQRLREEAEKTKIALSNASTYEVNLTIGGNDFVATVDRSEFEEMTQDLVQRTLKPCKDALAAAGLKPSDLNAVILVGGQTRMPAVIEAVKEFFGKEPKCDVNPDEIVAAGAGVQGGVISGESQLYTQLRDVTSMPFAIRNNKGLAVEIIPANTPLPAKGTLTFTTAEDDQENAVVKVCQGPRSKFEDNKFIGDVVLDGLPPASAGKLKIEVTLEADINGILTVSARTGVGDKMREKVVQLAGNTGLSDEEIERMTREAKENEEADRQHRALIEQIVQAEAELKKTAKDKNADWFKEGPADLREKFEQAVQGLSEAVEQKQSAEVIAEQRESLKKAKRALGDAFAEASDKTEAAANDDAPSETPAAKAGAKPKTPGE